MSSHEHYCSGRHKNRLDYLHFDIPIQFVYKKNHGGGGSIRLSVAFHSYPPPRRFVSGCTKTQKESDPGHLGHLFYILCGHFDERKKSSKVGGGGGVVDTSKYFKSPLKFLKNICMVW